MEIFSIYKYIFTYMKSILPNKDYLVINFTKEQLEQALLGKMVRFWTKDCTIWPDFDVAALVVGMGYFDNGEISISILRKRTGRASKTLNLSSRMNNLKFRILSD